MTLNGDYALCFKISFLEPITKIGMKIDLYYRRQKCGLVTQWRYLRGFPEEGRQTTVGLSTTAIFSAFADYIFVNLRVKASIIIWRYGFP